MLEPFVKLFGVQIDDKTQKRNASSATTFARNGNKNGA